MRKIERQMCAAIRNGQTWRNGNTEVRFENGAAIVALHHNRIAYIHKDGTVRISLAGWNTPTTRSRVNAILDQFVPGPWHVATSKGVAYLTHPRRDSIEITSDAWVTFDATGEPVTTGESPAQRLRRYIIEGIARDGDGETLFWSPLYDWHADRDNAMVFDTKAEGVERMMKIDTAKVSACYVCAVDFDPHTATIHDARD